MAFSLTRLARLKSAEGSKEPQLVLEIDGVPTIYGSTSILKYIQIGDTDLKIDGTWKIGGLRSIENQQNLIGFGSDAGTTTKITQQLDVEKGRGSSVQTMTIGLVDKNQEITRLISPGEVVEDVMGRRAKMYLGFNDTGYKRDFIPLFKGIIDDVSAGPGIIKLQLGSPEQKKRQEIFQKVQTELDGAIDSIQTTIPVVATTNFLTESFKPDGSPETALKRYIRIDDELIQYTGLTATSFTGCTRGALGTTADSHDDEGTVDSFYRLGPDNGIDLALKIMLGGWQGPFAEDVAVTNFVNISPSEQVINSIYFDGVNVAQEYGLSVGDYVSSSGASNATNNFTSKTISAITVVDDSSYIELNGVSLEQELNSNALLDFRSQYDTLPIGAGLKMLPDDVDVEEHQRIRALFFTSYDLDLYLQDTVNGKEFIETELYVPGAMFSVPRKARSSVGVSSGPLPGADTITLDETNVVNPTKLFIRRSLGKAFFNSVVYNYDQNALDSKYLSSLVSIAADSLDRIPVGARTLKIQSKGVRSELNGENLITSASNRRLKIYKYASEFLENVKVTYGVGFNVEVGDVLILDGTQLQISDSTNSKRGLEPRLFQVINKTIDVKSGEVSLNLLDTAFDVQNRYALVGPSSNFRAVLGPNEILIEPDGFYSRFGSDEGGKWRRYKRPTVKLRSADHSTFEILTINRVVGNSVSFLTNLTTTPSSGWVMELTNYNDATEQLKLLYGWMRDTPPFDDGKAQYLML